MEKKIKFKYLNRLFKDRRVVDISEVCKVLKTKSRVTAFRYLKQIDYITSITHSARYYTLPSIVEFNEDGLWYYGNIGFSKHGTLLNSLVYSVTHSEAGKTNAELEKQFRTRVQNSLLKLLKTNKIGREKLVKKTYLYVNPNPNKSEEQVELRKKLVKQKPISEWDAIEIFIEIIRLSSTSISLSTVVNSLRKRGSLITRNQVEQIFQKYGLEKKLWTPCHRILKTAL